MRPAALLVMLALSAACSSPAPAANQPSSPRVNPTAVVQVQTGSPVVDLPLSSVDFSCRLPVVKSTSGGDSIIYTGGFVTFPTANFRADPAGTIHSRYTEQDLVTDATPVLAGLAQAGDPFYDLGQRRWLPAAPAQSTPDGARYAYATVGASSSVPAHVHIVDVARATERVFDFPVPQVGAVNGVRVADFTTAGVYLIADRFETYPAGAWLLDPGTGAIRVLAQVNGVLWIRSGYAWVGRVDPRDPAPPSRPASGQWFDSIVRVDLESGAETLWFYRPGASLGLAGFDGEGAPVVEIAASASDTLDQGEFRAVDASGAVGRLVVRGGGHWLSGLQADGDRLWFGNDLGIYLWTSGGGLQKVFSFSGEPKLGENIKPAGFCR